MATLLLIEQNPIYFYSILCLLGLSVGSFLNVAIYRLPLMLEKQWHTDCKILLEGEEALDTTTGQASFNLLTPNSHCPSCERPIKPWQNIPLLSYLILAGKCADCGNKISRRYPIIEAITALLTVLSGFYFGASLAMGFVLLLTWSLIVLTMIDFDHQLLPDDITLPLIWLGLLANSFGVFTDLQSAVYGAIAGYLALWIVYWAFKLLTGKEGMGYGDFKLLSALGAWLGWQALPTIILLSSLVGTVVGIFVLIVKNKGKSVPIPFGPYLAIAGWIALIWGDQIIQSYLSYAGVR